MGWWRFWDKDPTTTAAPQAEEPSGPPRRERQRPDPFQRTQFDPTTERRIAELRRRRDAMRFDIEQGELALQEQNPWQERIDLLTESLATIDADIAALDAAPSAPAPSVDPTPIRDIEAIGGELARVGFTIGAERFRFEEQVDWDQRGGPTVRGDLQSVEGDIDRLIPAGFAVDAQRALRDHLADSVAVFATDLRDRALDGRPMPSSPTLADLARPCPACGGWMDWHGRCPACTVRDIERHRLRGEAERLDGERQKEADERHRLAEALPIARRRLAAVATDLRALGAELE